MSDDTTTTPEAPEPQAYRPQALGGAHYRAYGWAATKWDAWLHDVRSRKGNLRDGIDYLQEAAYAELLPRTLGDLHDDVATPSDREAMTALWDGCGRAAAAMSRGAFGHLYGDPMQLDKGPWWVRAAMSTLRAPPPQVDADALMAAIAAAEAPADGAPIELQRLPMLPREDGPLDDLRRLTRSDPDMAAIALASVIRELGEQLPAIFEAMDAAEADPNGGEDGDGGGSGADGDGLPDGVLQRVGDRVGMALRVAAAQAARDVADARGQLDGLLPGLGSCPRQADQIDPRRLELLELIRHDRRLQQILRIAGRVSRVADRVRRLRSDEVSAEVVDLERGADLQRVLPSELVGLCAAHPALRALTLKGIADRSLLQRRTDGTERLGRGPITVCLDVSGSMSAQLSDGMDRIGWAAAIAIAAVRAGQDQRRDVAVCIFDGAVLQHWMVRGRNGRREAETAILELAGIRAMGGTDFGPPIRWALDHGAEETRADIVFVTDGWGQIDDATAARLTAARERGLRVWGCIAGEGGLPDLLRTMADGVATIDTDTSDAAYAIGCAVAP